MVSRPQRLRLFDDTQYILASLSTPAVYIFIFHKGENARQAAGAAAEAGSVFVVFHGSFWHILSQEAMIMPGKS